MRLGLLMLLSTASAGLLDRAERSEAREACEAGERKACDVLKCHERNRDKCLWMGLRAVEQGEVQDALRVFDHACGEGLAGACVEAGLLYSGLGPEDPTNPRLAHARLARACDLGEPRGCRSLASFYGDDAFEHMTRWSIYSRQCKETLGGERDIPGACYVAGWYWVNGLGVEADAVRGCESVQRGCEAGSHAACEARPGLCG